MEKSFRGSSNKNRKSIPEKKLSALCASACNRRERAETSCAALSSAAAHSSIRDKISLFFETSPKVLARNTVRSRNADSKHSEAVSMVGTERKYGSTASHSGAL